MVITLVEKDKKNRVSIYVNDKFSFSISEDDYLRLGLYEKKEISEQEIQYIKFDVNVKKAKISGLKFLSYKLRTEAEVRKKLLDEDFEEEIIDCAMNELTDSGYINDVVYCEKYISDRIKLKPGSRKLLQYELEQKGVNRSIVAQVLNGFEIDELSIAISHIKKRYANYDLEDEKTLNKIYSFLYNKGFNYDIINQAILEVKSID